MSLSLSESPVAPSSSQAGLHAAIQGAHKAFTKSAYRLAMDQLKRRAVDQKADGMPRGWGVMLVLAVVLVALVVAARIFGR